MLYDYHRSPGHRDVLITWGDYIVDSLPDPGDQLCTDDFEGKSPHNVNLAAKVCTHVHIMCVDIFFIGPSSLLPLSWLTSSELEGLKTAIKLNQIPWDQ